MKTVQDINEYIKLLETYIQNADPEAKIEIQSLIEAYQSRLEVIDTNSV